MTRYAIILSVEDYSHFARTPFCHADASLLYSTLTERCDYAQQHVLLLNLLPGDGETPSRILDRVEKAVSGSVSGDTILFYFAGHGHQTKEKKTYLILPDTVPNKYENTALPLDDISNCLRLEDRPCFRMFDACHSGADVRDGIIPLNPGAFVRAVTHDPTGWVTLAACREDQYSASDPTIGQGIFTYYVCDFIMKTKSDEDIIPEILKVSIVDQIYDHAKRLGNIQTLTLNASISGNISLATRRTDISGKPIGDDKTSEEIKLQERIAKLRDIKDIITADYLGQTLENLLDSVRKELEDNLSLMSNISVGSPMSASNIPDGMHREVVILARRQGLDSRHNLVRWEEEIEDPQPFWGSAAVLASLFPRRKRKHVNFDIWQEDTMPDSAAVIELAGDGRCIPHVNVLVYVIPLQVTAFLLVSAFRREWPPNEDVLELISHSHTRLKPEDTPERARNLAPLAIKQIDEKLNQYVTNRVKGLEKELR